MEITCMSTPCASMSWSRSSGVKRTLGEVKPVRLPLVPRNVPSPSPGRDFPGRRVVIYRDATGRAVVQGAYCPHLGADLSVGEVVEGQVRCAYHHWKFDCAGTCVDIPAGDRIPPGARIPTYPSAEAWGLIWAFNGTAPTFPLPHLPPLDDP